MSYSATRRKRFTAGVLAGAMALTVTPILGFTGSAAALDPATGDDSVCENPPAEETFPDVSDTDPARDVITCLVNSGVTVGKADGTYDPNGNVTRGQMALFLVRLADELDDNEIDDEITAIPAGDGETDFTDVADQPAVFQDAIDRLSDAGIALGTGTGTTFSPRNPVSRAQMAAFIVRLQDFVAGDDDVTPEGDTDAFDDDDGEFGEEELNILAEEGVFLGTGDGNNVDPGGNITRRQMASVLVRKFQVFFESGDINALFPGDTNQELDVTPTDDVVLNTGQTRTYTVAGLDTDSVYRITLVNSDNITDPDGNATFVPTTMAAPCDVPYANPGPTTAVISAVNGTAVATPARSLGSQAPAGTTLSFTITSPSPSSVIPAVYVDNGPDGGCTLLELDEDNTPNEAFGLGGKTTFVTGDNATFSNAPELVSVNKTSDPAVLEFVYDEAVTGQALQFVGPDGARRYPGFPIYQPNGTPSYPFQASISNDRVLARYDSAATINNASRAGSRFNAVEDVTGLPSIEGDFPFAPTASPITTAPFAPQLLRVENYRTAPVISGGATRVLVDFVFQEPAGATTLDGAVTFSDVEFIGSDAGEFYLVGSNSALYQGDDVTDTATNAAGTETTVTVALADEPTDVPETQLRRGFFVVGDSSLNPNPAGADSVGDIPADADASYTGGAILSEEWGTTDGITIDPDLVNVQRTNATSFRFEFDEAISDTALDATNFYVFDAAGTTTPGSTAVRSAVAADGAKVAIVTFPALPTSGAGTPVGAYVIDDAVRATDSTAQGNGGFNRPAEVVLTLAAPTPQDIPSGVTALPDLTTITRSQNAVTGNFSVAFTFDQAVPADISEIDFDLFDANGTRFNDGATTCATAGVSCGANTVTFSIDGGFANYDNEQIAAAVTGGVQDSDILTGAVAPALTTAPVVTEGQVGVDG